MCVGMVEWPSTGHWLVQLLGLLGGTEFNETYRLYVSDPSPFLFRMSSPLKSMSSLSNIHSHVIVDVILRRNFSSV